MQSRFDQGWLEDHGRSAALAIWRPEHVRRSWRRRNHRGGKSRTQGRHRNQDAFSDSPISRIWKRPSANLFSIATFLQETGSDRELYLAVTEETCLKVFEAPVGQFMIRRQKLRVIVFDPDAEEIKRWLP
jgi:XisH protein